MTGFGVSEGFGQASVIMNAAAAPQAQALNLLFSPTSGAGLNMLRNEISADQGSTIEPTSPGSPTAAPTYSPLGNDQGQEWLASQIKSQFNVTNVFADAWSAPPFMKVNNSVDNGGALCGVPSATCASGDWRQAYANYLVQYAKDYAADGIPLTYLGPENEANFAPSNYDGMTLTPAQTASVLDVLGPTLAASGLSTQVECCATEGWDFAQQYSSAIESDATANSYTKVFTSHGYTAPPNSALNGWSKPAWQTEWSTFEGWDPAWDDGSAASGLTWAQHISTGITASNLSAFLYWWGSGTPSGNGDNESLIQINGSTVTPSGRLWAFANYSRYIHPGAVRIGATTADGNLTLTAYQNTDGSVAIVALNTGTSADPVTYSLQNTGVANGATVTPVLTNSTNNAATQATTTVSGGAFSSSVPARSLVTYVIPGSSGGGDTVTVTSPGNQTGTAGTAVTVPVQASDSATGQTLTYAATGLPAGLSINATTGVISGTPTATGTASVTVTATDGTGASGSASFTWTVNTGGQTGGGSSCHVTYTPNQWAGGFTANLTVADTGTTAINGWTLTFAFPGDQKITSAWNGTATQSGANVSITSVSYNANIPVGGSTQLGFQGTWTSNDSSPTSFAVNGGSCA
jgi:O-glycosyl hydrolase